MPTLPNWSLSQQSRARMTDLLKTAGELGLDPDALASGGLAALQALNALKRAKAAGAGDGRTQLIARAQEALQNLDPAGGVTQILFNDPEIRGVTKFAGHDNHLHVVVDPNYRRPLRR